MLDKARVVVKNEDYEDRAVKMAAYISDALFALPNLSTEARKQLSKFLDTRQACTGFQLLLLSLLL